MSELFFYVGQDPAEGVVPAELEGWDPAADLAPHPKLIEFASRAEQELRSRGLDLTDIFEDPVLASNVVGNGLYVILTHDEENASEGCSILLDLAETQDIQAFDPLLVAPAQWYPPSSSDTPPPPPPPAPPSG